LSPASETVTIPDLGTPDAEPVKIVISGLDTLNALGQAMYVTVEGSDYNVNKIHLYRETLYVGKTLWTDPLFIDTLTIVGGVWKSTLDNTLAAGTVEDMTQEPGYSPFTTANIYRYAVEDIFVHKGRTILVNDVDEFNQSVVRYGDMEMVESISPGNVRTIEPGDGQYLYAGKSVGDYAIFWKDRRIYGILGDVYNGQIVNISETVGCRFKKLIAVHNNVAYFLSDFGPYVVANAQCSSISNDVLRNYFDKNRDECLDFANLSNGYANVDLQRNEIRWHVPVKVAGAAQTENNLIIIYNIQYNYFRTHQLNSNIFVEESARDIVTGENLVLMGDYNGNIYEQSADKNDDGKAVKYIVRTKEFNLGNDMISKAFRFIEMYGKNLRNMTITYWIDGVRVVGQLTYSPGLKDRAFVNTWSTGRCNTIMIEISGADVNAVPFEIDDILIGYDRMAGIL
jgi:hypothetical protein